MPAFAGMTDKNMAPSAYGEGLVSSGVPSRSVAAADLAVVDPNSAAMLLLVPAALVVMAAVVPVIVVAYAGAAIVMPLRRDRRGQAEAGGGKGCNGGDHLEFHSVSPVA